MSIILVVLSFRPMKMMIYDDIVLIFEDEGMAIARPPPHGTTTTTTFLVVGRICRGLSNLLLLLPLVTRRLPNGRQAGPLALGSHTNTLDTLDSP